MLTDWISNTLGLSPETQSKLFATLLIVLVLWLIRIFSIRLLKRRVEDASLAYHWRKGIEYAAIFIGIILVARIWLEGIESLATYLGLVTAGLAIALQDPIINLVAWMYIVVRRPFDVGDRVQVGEYGGDVIDISFFQFTLNEIGRWVHAEQSTGRVVHVPNRQVFSVPLINYHQGSPYLWDEVEVLITFESDWQRTKKLLTDIVDKQTVKLDPLRLSKAQHHARPYLLKLSNVSPRIYTSVTPSGVALNMRYLVPPHQRRNKREELWEAVLITIANEPQINLAYPTQRFYFNPTEGADGTPLHREATS